MSQSVCDHDKKLKMSLKSSLSTLYVSEQAFW